MYYIFERSSLLPLILLRRLTIMHKLSGESRVLKLILAITRNAVDFFISQQKSTPLGGKFSAATRDGDYEVIKIRDLLYETRNIV